MRDSNLKIPDVRAFRSLTHLLGKLGIKSCYRVIPIYNPFTSVPQPEYNIECGLGIKEAKDLVERMWDYQPISNSPLDRLQKANALHCIKRTRQFMNMLNKLGLKSPDSGLQACRGFVTRTTR